MSEPTARTLTLAFEALASLVRSEYPEHLSLSEMVHRWTELDSEYVEAVAQVESGQRMTESA